MFTGIITHIGRLHKRENTIYSFLADGAFIRKIEYGTSVSVNGVCLTVNDIPAKNSFSIEVMPETQRKTMLADLQPDNIVNLELPATTETFLSGHIVQGHVDGIGSIKSMVLEKNSRIFTITIPENLGKYIVEKGSISVNGISLTVIEAHQTYFTVGIIPYTWEHTMLHTANLGDKVNIEVDVLAKYIEKLLQKE